MRKIKLVGLVLFWMTLISPIIAFVVASRIGEVEIFGILGIIRYAWTMWFFIPIGVVSILIGKRLKNNNQKYLKNYIIAYIAIPLIILYGMISFVSNEVSYDADKIRIIEENTNLELPSQIKIATMRLSTHNLSYIKIINEEDKSAFESVIQNHEYWTPNLGTKIKSLLPMDVQFEISTFDYFVFYNVTTSAFNTYPTDGVYESIFIAYDSTLQRLVIVDGLVIDIN